MQTAGETVSHPGVSLCLEEGSLTRDKYWYSQKSQCALWSRLSGRSDRNCPGDEHGREAPYNGEGKGILGVNNQPYSCPHLESTSPTPCYRPLLVRPQL